MKTIVVVGVGALGSHVVQALRNVEATLRVIDFDRVEQRNVASQFHGKPNVGKLKVQSLQQSMKFLFGRDIGIVSHKLVTDNVKELLGKADLLLDCLDNGAARRLVQQFARTSSTACLHGALDAQGSFGRVVWDESFVIDDEGVAGAATCEDGAHLPFITVVAANLAYSAQRFLRDGRKVGFEISPGGSIRT
jgi:molybdopterin/thiamine biosynthesis adenylyltransferase